VVFSSLRREEELVIRLRSILVGAAFALVAGAVSAGELTVFAAASLTDALGEIGAAYQKTSADRVLYNFAASSLLARQIQEGAPADLFFSADEEKMDGLVGRNLVAKETRVSLLSNTLAVVVARDSALAIRSPEDLAASSVRKLALAQPQTVPAGIYAKAYLVGIGLWPKVADRVVPTENVRAALAAVESGNADAGIVYRTDAWISKNVRIAWEVPRETGPRISYPVAVLSGSKDPAGARRFLAYLQAPPALDVFRRFGFLLLR
jgi:molybdate transport system substrate-binding protein